jgi:hypothetical protein
MSANTIFMPIIVSIGSKEGDALFTKLYTRQWAESKGGARGLSALLGASLGYVNRLAA